MNLNLLPDLALFVQIVEQGSFFRRRPPERPYPLRREPQRLAAGAGNELQAAAPNHTQTTAERCRESGV